MPTLLFKVIVRICGFWEIFPGELACLAWCRFGAVSHFPSCLLSLVHAPAYPAADRLWWLSQRWWYSSLACKQLLHVMFFSDKSRKETPGDVYMCVCVTNFCWVRFLVDWFGGGGVTVSLLLLPSGRGCCGGGLTNISAVCEWGDGWPTIHEYCLLISTCRGWVGGVVLDCDGGGGGGVVGGGTHHRCYLWMHCCWGVGRGAH